MYSSDFSGCTLTYCIPLVKYHNKFYAFKKKGFTPCKAEQLLQDMKLQEKEAKNDLAICISIKAFNWFNRKQLNILKTILKSGILYCCLVKMIQP